MLNDTIGIGAGGQNVGTTIEGRRRFAVRVRFAEQYRTDVRALGDLPIEAHGGSYIPLNRVAEIKDATGPAMINSENGLLQVSVLLSVRGRDIGGFVEEANRVTRQKVNLP